MIGLDVLSLKPFDIIGKKRDGSFESPNDGMEKDFFKLIHLMR